MEQSASQYAALMTGAVMGIEAHPVNVEIDISRGLPNFNIVGLPDTSVKESRERVRSAIQHSGCEFPLGRITANLAPGDTRKEGPSFDLSLAVGILAATGQVDPERAANYLYIGELKLDGTLQPCRGVLP
ncbi:MAG: magnesium chelatase domain-containing protein, partial [Gemmatimonadota bacterium]|nr:magnesium chelatase domain-containing protein [Gemmatimonadota bacterium]